MKTLNSRLAASALLSLACVFGSSTARSKDSGEFPYTVQYELGSADFVNGDAISIVAVHGTSETIMTGQTYCVEGTYALISEPEADLALFATVENGGPTPIDPKQTVRIEKGTGSFRLIKTMNEEGYLHVSFYSRSSGKGFGGIYFGQGRWVLRDKGFSYSKTSSGYRDTIGAGGASPDASPLSGANRTIFVYLGAPVDPPANMDASYSKEGLMNALQQAAGKAGISIKKVEIDDSEFPFLLGIFCDDADFPKLEDPIKKMPGYDYSGSVGGGGCHAINIVPWRAFPSESSQRIGHRLTLRQQIFFDRINAQK